MEQTAAIADQMIKMKVKGITTNRPKWLKLELNSYEVE